MRERFGDWGAELSDADFACALAAAGVLSWIASPAWTAERWADSLLRSARPGRLFWRFVERSFRYDAATLLEAWGLFRVHMTYGDSPMRLFVFDSRELKRRGIALRWIAQQLSRSDIGALSVEVVQDRGGSESVRGHKGAQSYSTPVDKEPDHEPPIKTGYPVLGDYVAPSPRFLQTQLYDLSRPGVRIRRGLAPGRTYAAFIRVGLADRGWLRAERPLPLPGDDAGPQGHELSVIF